MKKATNTNLDNKFHRECDLKRLQLTSNDFVNPDTSTEATVKCTSKKRSKNKLKGGLMHESIEINDTYLDEILHIKNN